MREEGKVKEERSCKKKGGRKERMEGDEGL